MKNFSIADKSPNKLVCLRVAISARIKKYSGDRPCFILLDLPPMPTNLIVIVAAIIIAWLVFTAFVNVIKTSVKTAVSIAIVVLLVQIAFGVRSGQIIDVLLDLPRIIWQFFTR